MAALDPSPSPLAGSLALCIVLGACGSTDRPSAPEVGVRDSAGIAIVENATELSALPVWRLASEPILRIGELDGPPELRFFRIADAVALEDGRIVVADGGNREIRVFDARGAHLRSFGSEGEGPEEFLAPGHLWVKGDTLDVYDDRLLRTSTWTLGGEHLDVRALAPPVRGEGLDRFADGGLLLIELIVDPPTTDFAWWSLRLHLYGRDAVRRSTIGPRRWMEYGLVPDHGGGPPHFAPRAVAAAGDGRVYFGTARSYEIEVLAPDGERTRLIRWRGPPRDVTEAHVLALREAELARIEEEGPAAARRQWAARFDAFPVSERLPTLVTLHVARDGALWAREFAPPGTSTDQRWLIFGPDGALEARVELPERFRLLDAGAADVLGVETDALGVERVVRYGDGRPIRAGTAAGPS